ncbi:MAG: FliO/MopB family protein [Acidimicrobiales bacterium]
MILASAPTAPHAAASTGTSSTGIPAASVTSTTSAPTSTTSTTSTSLSHVAHHVAAATHLAHHAATATHAAHHASAPVTVSLPGLILQVAIALGVIVLFVWVVSKVARSRAGKILLGGAGVNGLFGGSGGKRQAPINVVSRQMLGKGISLIIVAVEGRLLLLGATQHNVSVLADLTEPQELAGSGAVGANGEVPGGIASGPLAAGAGSPIEYLRELTVRRSGIRQ